MGQVHPSGTPELHRLAPSLVGRTRTSVAHRGKNLAGLHLAQVGRQDEPLQVGREVRLDRVHGAEQDEDPGGVAQASAVSDDRCPGESGQYVSKQSIETKPIHC